MSDPSPSGETWVCTAANALTSPCTERRPHDFGGSTCGPVPSSDTPSDERREHVIGTAAPHTRNVEPWDCLACNPNGWPKDRWIDNEQRRRSYNAETMRTRPAPPPTPVDGDSGRWTLVHDRRQAPRPWSLYRPDGRCYGTLTEDEAATLQRSDLAPSSPPVGEERRPVDVTALPEWEAFVKRHQHHVRLGLGQRGECADCSLIEAVAAADRGDRA